jgi:predicted nucleic acid-binding protein
VVSVGLGDTSVFIARESSRPLAISLIPDELLVSVITIGELRAGILSASTSAARDVRLETLTEAQSREPVPVDGDVAERWATLRSRLRESGQRMPINDSWIAATAMSLGIPIVTQDDDYVEIAGLDVIRV